MSREGNSAPVSARTGQHKQGTLNDGPQGPVPQNLGLVTRRVLWMMNHKRKFNLSVPVWLFIPTTGALGSQTDWRDDCSGDLS